MKVFRTPGLHQNSDLPDLGQLKVCLSRSVDGPGLSPGFAGYSGAEFSPGSNCRGHTWSGVRMGWSWSRSPQPEGRGGGEGEGGGRGERGRRGVKGGGGEDRPPARRETRGGLEEEEEEGGGANGVACWTGAMAWAVGAVGRGNRLGQGSHKSLQRHGAPTAGAPAHKAPGHGSWRGRPVFRPVTAT